MLYLSRIAGDDCFGIVDTDDNVETIVNRTELSDIVIDLELPVEGVTIMQGNMGRYIQKISVWQDSQYCTPFQVKTKTMLGVDVTLFKGEIVGICLLRPLQKETVIRLSDYAKSISTYSMIRGTRGGFGVVLKFDDNIRVTGEYFVVNSPGFIFDVREVTNWDTLRAVYEYIVEQYPPDVDSWRGNVLDISERSAFWNCVRLLTTLDDGAYTSLQEIIRKNDKAALCAQLEQYFDKEFSVLADGLFGYVKVAHRSSTVKMVQKNLPRFWSLVQECNNFEIAIRRLWEIDKLRSVCEYLDYKSSIRILTYTRAFDISDHVKQLCLQYYRHLCDTIIEFCKSVGIPYER